MPNNEIMHRFIVTVADILLWRNEKASFTCFLGLVFLFYWFFLSGSTFISSAARLLLLATLLLCGHGFLSSKLYVYTHIDFNFIFMHF